jgi:hypothetical protein
VSRLPAERCVRRANRMMVPAFGETSPSGLDDVPDSGRIFVFPEPEDAPTRGLESCVVADVSGSIASQFVSPPARVCLWLDTMHWAPMPKASIDLNDQPSATEDDVGSPRKPSDVDSIAESTPMKLAPNCHLRSCPRRGELRHETSDLRRRCRGLGALSPARRHV